MRRLAARPRGLRGSASAMAKLRAGGRRGGSRGADLPQSDGMLTIGAIVWEGADIERATRLQTRRAGAGA